MNIFTSKGCIRALVFTLLTYSGIYSTTLSSQSKNCDTETAFAFLNNDNDPSTADSESNCFIPQFNRWGWTTYLDFSENSGQSNYVLDIYAGAGQCDLSKGTDVGSVSITYNNDSSLTFDYNLEGYVLSEAHIYVGSNPYPTTNSGHETVAPGQYTFTDSDFGSVSDYSTTISVEGKAFYIIVHGVTQAAECVDTSDEEDCPDIDKDGICDEDDICPGFDDSIDSDGDGIPDGCDTQDCPDSDKDGVCDEDDICPDFDDTIDSDGDGIPDGCDTEDCIDSDGDTVCDDDDVCPGFDDTIDNDGNGIPDGCDSVYAPADDVKIYSNSDDGKLNISYNFDYETTVLVEIFDVRGVKLTEMKDVTYRNGITARVALDMSRSTNQLLFVRLTTEKTQLTKKIIYSN